MVVRHGSISEAYSVLGLEKGSSLEAVKSAYKQLALRTHPDKNQNNPDSTVQFQQISSAYNVLLKHLDTSTPPPMPHGFPAFHYFHSTSNSSIYEDEDDDTSDDYHDSEGEEYYVEEEEDNLDFFMFLFEELVNGRANRFAGARFQSRVRQHDVETEEQYQARIRLQREEQAAAAKRRKAQEEAQKLRRQMERESEARAGEERRRKKAGAKKAEAAAARRSAAQIVRSQQQKSQALRSAVFAAARRGDAAHVKKAVWEDGVDAAGGEVRPGTTDEFVEVKPEDPKQTLLHLAVGCGDVELVEWLERHNAEADERDSQGRTAFHVALECGHVPIIRHFLDAHPPKDRDSAPVLHAAQGCKPLLRLAFSSGEPEVVWLVLDSGMADTKAVLDTCAWICANDGQARKEFGSVGKRGRPFDEDKFEETKELVISWGGFTPPPTPNGLSAAEPRPPETSSASHRKEKKNNKKSKQQSQHGEDQTVTPVELPPTPPPSHCSSSVSQSTPASHGSSRPAGRGKSGKGRGRGRGHGKGAAPHP